MGTSIRPELSLNSEFWLDRHRYYELKHFCLQYPLWKQSYSALDGLSKYPVDLAMLSNANVISNPTAGCAEAKSFYADRIKMIEATAAGTDSELASYILKAVTKGLSYNHFKTGSEIPCGRDTYYRYYRLFFLRLNRVRQ